MVFFFFLPFFKGKIWTFSYAEIINTTKNKALALIKIPSMPEFAKISGPKQNRLGGKSGNPFYLAVVEGIRGEFGMLPSPFLQTHALYFSRILL